MEPWILVWSFLLVILLSLAPKRTEKQGPFQLVGSSVARVLGAFSIHDAINHGYETITKVSGLPFRVNVFCKEYVILPPRYLKDIKRSGRENLSFGHAISDVFFLRASVGEFLAESIRPVRVVQKSLNPRLPQVTQSIVQELDHAVQAEIGQIAASKEVIAANVVNGIVQKTALRLIIGTRAARHGDLQDYSARAIQSIFLNAMIILLLPFGPLRTWLQGPITRVWHLRNYRRLVVKMGSVVRERIAERGEQQVEGFSHDNTLDWTLDHTERKIDEAEINLISMELVQHLWASTSSPSAMITEMLYQALSEERYMKALRAEADEAISRHGWSEQMINSLPLQDSFIREVNRMYPTGTITCLRTVMGTPFSFSDGLTFSPGTRIAFALEAAQRDGDHFGNAAKFDGFRFVRLNSQNSRNEDQVSKWGAANASMTNLVFGYGNHLCPGRFMAIRLIKVIFSRLLLDYEISWKRQEGYLPGRIKVEGQYAPNQSERIMLAKRSVAS